MCSNIYDYVIDLEVNGSTKRKNLNIWRMKLVLSVDKKIHLYNIAKNVFLAEVTLTNYL